MNTITFIIPSKGRKTLTNTIQSLYLQFYNNWNACVCYDDVEPTMDPSYKIEVVRTNHKLGEGVNGAGKVRNEAINHMHRNGLLGDFIGFVDDDDKLSDEYVKFLTLNAIENPDIDIFVFKMKYADGNILPPDGIEDISQLENKIGISFCMKSKLFLDGLTFSPSSGEDYNILKEAHLAGCKFKFIKKIGYLVAPLGLPEDRR